MQRMTTGRWWGICCALACAAGVSHATDAPTTSAAVPHIFVPGEIVSADQLNENFAAITPDLSETLIGTWSTQCWDSYTDSADAPGTGTITITSLSSVAITGSVCIAGMVGDNDDWNGSPPTISRMTPLGQRAVFTEITYANGTPVKRTAEVLRIEPDFLMITTGSNGVELLTRLDGPPANPRTLSASASGSTVSLSWTDRSTDETSFRVLRRYSAGGTLDGSETFTAVGTTAADATSTTDTVTAAGTYWYRVQAVGANGTSLGTNIVKVTIE